MEPLPKVLFFVSCFGCGLTALLTEMTCSLQGHTGERLLCVTSETEQFPGLFDRLKCVGVGFRIVKGLDAHGDFGRLLTEFCQLIEEFNPDVVQVQSNWQLILAVRARTRCRSLFRIAYWVHGYRHNEPLKSVLATAIIGSALALWADRVIVNSSCVRRRFRFLGGKLRQISLGVDRSLLYAFQPPNYGSKPKRLIFPGQFRRGKNQAWLIQALADYCRQTGDREVELVLPGAGDSLNECKHLAERLNVGGLVCFPGQVSRNQIIEAYLKSQVAIIPSNYETFGSCIAEPLALGRIVLSRPVGCAEDLIVHGENGFLFSSKQELQELLIRVLPDLSRYRRVGEQARELRSKFDWDRIAGEYCEILKR